jgi:hypothetical protein
LNPYPAEKCRQNFQADRLGFLEIDDEFKSDWMLEGQVRRRAPQDASNEFAAASSAHSCRHLALA